MEKSIYNPKWGEKLTSYFCLPALNSLAIISILLLTSCTDAGLITPPTQTIGATINSQAREADPQFSYDGRYLVFTSERQGKKSVFLYNLSERQLVPLPGLNQIGSLQAQPDISADGRYLVYLSEEQGKTDIFIYDRQTLRGENLTKDLLVPVRNPSISGNGRFVAFESNRNGQWNIEIYDRGSNSELSSPGNPSEIKNSIPTEEE